MNVCADRYLMHYGTKGMHPGQHDPNKRWQSQAVYAQGKPNPNARVRGAKEGNKYGNHLDAADAANEIAKLYNDDKLKSHADELKNACKKGDEKAIYKSLKNVDEYIDNELYMPHTGGYGVPGLGWRPVKDSRPDPASIDKAFDKLNKAESAILKQVKEQRRQEKQQAREQRQQKVKDTVDRIKSEYGSIATKTGRMGVRETNPDRLDTKKIKETAQNVKGTATKKLNDRYKDHLRKASSLESTVKRYQDKLDEYRKNGITPGDVADLTRTGGDAKRTYDTFRMYRGIQNDHANMAKIDEQLLKWLGVNPR